MFVRAEQVRCSVAEGIGRRARLEDLEGEKRELEARHERLKLPAVDWELVDALVENFEQVMANGPPPPPEEAPPPPAGEEGTGP